MKYQHWTDKETDYLKKNFSFTPNKSLSEKLCRTERSIGEKARRLGLLKMGRLSNPRKDIDNLLLRKLYKSGLSTNEIAERINCSQDTVKRRL